MEIGDVPASSPIETHNTQLGACSGTTVNFASVTTTATDLIVGLLFSDDAGGPGPSAYSATVPYTIQQATSIAIGGLWPYMDSAVIAGLVGSGTITPTMTMTNCQAGTFTAAFKDGGTDEWAQPRFRYPTYGDWVNEGLLPDQSGNAGECVATDGTRLGFIACSATAVTSFSAGNLSPLFTTSVATATTTPALSFSLSNAGAYTFFGNKTAASAVPNFFQLTASLAALATDVNHQVVGAALSGNTSKLGTVSGTITPLNCLEWDTSGNITGTGAGCASGGLPSSVKYNNIAYSAPSTLQGVGPQVYSGELFGIVSDWNGSTGTDNCAAFTTSVTGALAVLNAIGSGNHLKLPLGGGTLVSSCDMSLGSVIIDGSSSSVDEYIGSAAPPSSQLVMTKSGGAAHLQCLTQGDCGIHNLTFSDPANSTTTMMLFTCGTPQVDGLLIGKTSALSGTPGNTGINFGTPGDTTAGCGNTARDFSGYANNHISIYCQNMATCASLNEDANNIHGYVRGDYSDAATTGYLVQISSSNSAHPAYGSTLNIDCEQGPYGGGSLLYKGCLGLLLNAVGNQATVSASDVGTSLHGIWVTDVSSADNDLTLLTGYYSGGTSVGISDVSGNGANKLTDMPLKTETIRNTNVVYATVQTIIPNSFYSVAGVPLPSCGSTMVGHETWVSDATTVTAGATYAGSGTYSTSVECIKNSTGPVYTWVVTGASGGGGGPGGSTGDMQINNGSGGFAAGHINDTGSELNITETVSSILGTAGTGGVTLNLLVAGDTSNPVNYVLPPSGHCGIGFALSTATIGNTFQVGNHVGSVYTGVADGSITSGHILIGGTSTPGRVGDSGVTQITGIPAGTCVVGKALASATVGNTVPVLYLGLGTFGTSGTATYTGSLTASHIATWTGTGGQLQDSGALIPQPYYGFAFQGAVGASATGLQQAQVNRTVPANFTTPTTVCKCGTNPTSSFALTLKDGASTLGTLTLDSSCALTAATTGGTTQSITAGDQLYLIAPGSADATAANITCNVLVN